MGDFSLPLKTFMLLTSSTSMAHFKVGIVARQWTLWFVGKKKPAEKLCSTHVLPFTRDMYGALVCFFKLIDLSGVMHRIHKTTNTTETSREMKSYFLWDIHVFNEQKFLLWQHILYVGFPGIAIRAQERHAFILSWEADGNFCPNIFGTRYVDGGPVFP